MTILQYVVDNLLWLNTDYLEASWTVFKQTFIYYYSSDYTLIFTVKVTFCLSFLILIRGGVPRYRYDFLTKIGWVKFLGYVLSVFLLTVFFFLIW